MCVLVLEDRNLGGEGKGERGEKSSTMASLAEATRRREESAPAARKKCSIDCISLLPPLHSLGLYTSATMFRADNAPLFPFSSLPSPLSPLISNLPLLSRALRREEIDCSAAPHDPVYSSPRYTSLALLKKREEGEESRVQRREETKQVSFLCRPCLKRSTHPSMIWRERRGVRGEDVVTIGRDEGKENLGRGGEVRGDEVR